MYDSTVKLPGGRRLGFAEYGSQTGLPVIMYHGTPGSRFHPLAALCTQNSNPHNLRVIVPERPGCGLSDAQPGRTVGDHVNNVQYLADFLGIERFSVIGISGGAPYALATAAALGQRVERVAIVCGIAPLDAPGMREQFGASQRMLLSGVEEAKVEVYQMAKMVSANADAVLAHVCAGLPEEERNLIGEEMLPLYRSLLVESYQNAEGIVDDYAVIAAPWGFGLDQIRVPVHLWHGINDKDVYIANAQYLNDQIPDSVLHTLPIGGHLTTAVICHQDVAEFVEQCFNTVQPQME